MSDITEYAERIKTYDNVVVCDAYSYKHRQWYFSSTYKHIKNL